MTTAIDPHQTLHQLFSPAFPVGAFAWSHGLETAIQAGDITGANQAQAFIETVLSYGAGWGDAVLCAHAYQGGTQDLDALALALAPSSERRAETREQGHAFARTVRDVWGAEVADAAYPVAVGTALRALDLPLEAGLRTYLQSIVATLASVAVRLVPLGQTDGQRITQALTPLCADTAARATRAGLEEIGGFAPMLDIRSQQHETLYSRIFRS